MKHHGHTFIREGFLGAEILHSTPKCRSGINKVIFAGAEKYPSGDMWKINFIFTFFSISQGDCQCASSANMFVQGAPGHILRFEKYLGILGKETVEHAPEDYALCERFFPVQRIKLLQIETDFIQYEIHFN